MAEQKYIEINNIAFPVSLYDVKRNFDSLDKYAYRTEDGVLHRKCIGIYKNYKVSVAIENNIQLYDAFVEAITSPVNSFMIKLPNEIVAQERYIGSISDEISRVTEDGTLYKGLTFSVICVAPTRKGN